jgi:hypothetical protein
MTLARSALIYRKPFAKPSKPTMVGPSQSPDFQIRYWAVLRGVLKRKNSEKTSPYLSV